LMKINQPFAFLELLNFLRRLSRFPISKPSVTPDISLAAIVIKSPEFSGIILLTIRHNASIIQPF